MKDRSKQIFSIIISIALILGGFYGLSLIAPPHGENHRNPIFGALVGLILIGIYQNYVHSDWIYNARLLLNAVAFALGMMLWAIPEVINSGVGAHLFRILMLNTLVGFLFGLFIGIYQFFTNLYRKKRTPFQGNQEPLVSSSAHVIYSGGTVSDKGRAILLSDRLIFLSPDSKTQTVFFREIKEIEIARTAGFPNKLILILEGAESMALSISMPNYWKNRINSLSLSI
jgi:hypothetical protein